MTFNLSENIFLESTGNIEVIDSEKVKEFIRLLKEGLGRITFNSDEILNKAMHSPIDDTINELAGDELNGS